jgi:hypothetical protein
LERALDPRVPENAAGQICPTIHMETDPSEIFQRLGVPVPRNQPL